MRQLSSTQLADYLLEHQPLLLDVREPWEYQICHLPDSQLMPMSQFTGQVGQLDPERETVVICHHGIRSRQVAMYLEHLGFGNIINLADGIDGWARSVDPQMAVY